jgi:hypothetical protein
VEIVFVITNVDKDPVEIGAFGMSTPSAMAADVRCSVSVATTLQAHSWLDHSRKGVIVCAR